MNKQTAFMTLAIVTGLGMMGCNRPSLGLQESLPENDQPLIKTESPELVPTLPIEPIEKEAKSPVESLNFKRRAGFTTEEFARRYNVDLHIDIHRDHAVGYLMAESCSGRFEIKYATAYELAKEIISAKQSAPDKNLGIMDAGFNGLTYRPAGGEEHSVTLGGTASPGVPEIVDSGRILKILQGLIQSRQDQCAPPSPARPTVIIAERLSIKTGATVGVALPFESVRAKMAITNKGVQVFAELSSHDLKTKRRCSAQVNAFIPDLQKDAQEVAIFVNLAKCAPVQMFAGPVSPGALKVSMRTNQGILGPAGFGCGYGYRVRDPRQFFAQVQKLLVSRQNCVKDPFQLGTK